MLRALPRALRLPRPWMSLGARDCASHSRTPEIQVQALTGHNQGKVVRRDPTRGETEAGQLEDWISKRANRELPKRSWRPGEVWSREESWEQGCAPGDRDESAGQDFFLVEPWQ